MDYSSLDYLNFNQAISYLQIRYRLTLNKDDLLSHCEEGKCQTYIKTFSTLGWTEARVAPPRGVGHQQVLNPGDLFAPDAVIELYLLGDVRLDPDPDDVGLLTSEEWQIRMPKDQIHLRFRLSDLDALAELIGSKKKPLIAPQSEKTMLLMIARMMEIITDSTSKSTQDTIAEDIKDTYSWVPGIGKRTINGIFSDANKERKALGTPPPKK